MEVESQIKKTESEQAKPSEVTSEDLKSAFEKPKKHHLPLVTLLVGIAILIAGATMLIMRLVIKPGMRDAEFLVEMGEWQREDADGVIWNFTEIGKGTLTTNNHENDYDFLWSIDGDTLKIETNWLYNLENEYTYKLQQDNKTLILSSKTDNGSAATGSADGSANINFRAAGRVNTEVSEDN